MLSNDVSDLFNRSIEIGVMVRQTWFLSVILNTKLLSHSHPQWRSERLSWTSRCEHRSLGREHRIAASLLVVRRHRLSNRWLGREDSGVSHRLTFRQVQADRSGNQSEKTDQGSSRSWNERQWVLQSTDPTSASTEYQRVTKEINYDGKSRRATRLCLHTTRDLHELLSRHEWFHLDDRIEGVCTLAMQWLLETIPGKFD